MSISLISFTGSNAVGKKVQELAAKSNLKKVMLELGGKNPSIVFNDAELNNAIAWNTQGFLFNMGQSCVAGTKVLVQSGVADKFIAALKDAFVQTTKVLGGDPLDKATPIGPLVDKKQYDRVTSYIESAKKDGSVVVVEARRAASGHTATVVPIGDALARYDRPAPTIDHYDQLLEAR